LAHSNVDIKYGKHEIVSKIISFSVHKIVGKERDNMVIKACFLHDEGEEVMVK